ncbi:hypothetical protein B0A50_08322 [Salinomyces thailandicus]|uniref:Triacylglycerol lipase n=1 Tax=Salinomyces thailandicus TaxID=706561 RepID=A0A4U0TK29_9PEZI|nr:hypothetical protein B0A50_08322 [Salinomyces thailandica]
MQSSLLGALLAATAACASPIVERAAASASTPHNDFTCTSTTHPNPVVLLHGLGATYYEDINALEAYLKSQQYCTFSITYGEFVEEYPYVGGLKPINESASDIGAFVKQVAAAYPDNKVDLVGHSEGAFQSLYVPKFEAGVSDVVRQVFAIAPPTHGTTFAGTYTLSYLAGNLTNNLVQAVLELGCPACNDLVTNGEAVRDLNNGPITQQGISYTVLTSRYDELVTPTDTAFVNEAAVRNMYIQDYCPLDLVGHIGEAYDLNVWTLVDNTLSGSTAGPEICYPGPLVGK